MKKELMILQVDKDYASRRIEELTQKIQNLGPEFHDVFNQSSETWHDNAPFDALRDKQSVLDAELQNLRGTLRNSLPSIPRQNNRRVGIGCKVVIIDSAGVETSYYIAGDWTPRAGSIIDGMLVISRLAPVAKSLLRHTTGEKVTIKNKVYSIIDIDYKAQLHY